MGYLCSFIVSPHKMQMTNIQKVAKKIQNTESNLTVQKPSRHHLNLVIKMNINNVPPDRRIQ